MKKPCLLLIMFFAFNALYSMDSDISISLGVLGLGVNSTTGISGGVLYGRLFTFMYQSQFGIGSTVSPAVFKMDITDTDNLSLTFINTSLFFNFLRQHRKLVILGPFVGMNAVNYGNPCFFEFHSGLMFSLHNILSDDLHPDESIFDSEVLHIELGYTYNHIDKSGFYAEIGVDLIAAIYYWGILYGTGNKYEKYD